MGLRHPVMSICFSGRQVAGHFRERAIIDRALLRKMTYKDKATYGSSPPCNVDLLFWQTSWK